MKDLLGVMARALVNNPQGVNVVAVESDHTTVFELKVDKSDLGQIIGRQGQNAQAMRVILQAASGKAKRRSVLEIVE